MLSNWRSLSDLFQSTCTIHLVHCLRLTLISRLSQTNFLVSEDKKQFQKQRVEKCSNWGILKQEMLWFPSQNGSFIIEDNCFSPNFPIVGKSEFVPFLPSCKSTETRVLALLCYFVTVLWWCLNSPNYKTDKPSADDTFSALAQRIPFLILNFLFFIFPKYEIFVCY